MGTLPTREVAPDGEDLWQFDTTTSTWSRLETIGAKPIQRSFHTMTIVGSTLFLHAGCPEKGRVASLHSIDLNSLPLTWHELPEAPGPGRGGTVICSLPTASPILARFGGFAGFELATFSFYDVVKQTWTLIDELPVENGAKGPEARSVHALVPLSGNLKYEDKSLVAVMALGEREGAPSELGHDGAGFVNSHNSSGRFW